MIVRPGTLLYHGTSTVHLADIAARGLIPQPCKDDVLRGAPMPRTGVYLAASLLEAGDFADLRVDRVGGEGVILAVRFADLHVDLLRPDDYDLADLIADHAGPGLAPSEGARTGLPPDPRLAEYRSWRDVPWQLSLAVCGQTMYEATIPAAQLLLLQHGSQWEAIPLLGNDEPARAMSPR